MTSSSLARCIAGSALAAFLVAAPIKLAAQPSSALDLAGATASGSYLAARHAGQQRDAAAAAAYYRSALKRDPNNGELLDRAFLSLLVDGDIDEAVKFAERVAQADKNDRVARLVLGVHGSSTSNMPPRAAIWRNRFADRSPISPRRCSRPGAHMAPSQ